MSTTVAPWWARFIVTLALLGLATRLLVSLDQLAVAGTIVGYVAAHWLPTAGRDSAAGPEVPDG